MLSIYFYLIRSGHIIKFLSGLLLLIFALSITPKRYLHNIFAKHIDNQHKKYSDKPYQLTNSGYNCDTDNLVAQSTFISDYTSLEFPLFSSFSTYVLNKIFFSSRIEIYSPLRGPPVNI